MEHEIPFASDIDGLKGLALLFLQTERVAASRITGYVEDVVPNLTANMFKRHFRMNRDTFHWLLEGLRNLKDLPELIPKNIEHGGRPYHGSPHAFVFEVHVGEFVFKFVIKRA